MRLSEVFCGLLDGRIATLEEAFDEIITSINACDAFDISTPSKQIMFDIVKASKQWKGCTHVNHLLRVPASF